MKLKYIFLTLALVGFAIGISDPQPTAYPDLAPPLVAILLGLFLVTQLLEKESALLEEQNRAAAQARNEPVRNPRSPKNSRNEVATHPVPTLARIH